ncbi:MAG: acyl-CoA dehydrogenase family protein [Pseudomonadota bacterium]
MEFALSEEQILLQDSIRRLLEQHAGLDTVRAYAEGQEPALSKTLWHQLAELGLAALLIPEDRGGLAMTALDAALVAECLGQSVAPAPLLGSGLIAPWLLAQAGTASELLGELADGNRCVGIGFSEAAGAREDAGIAADAAASTLTGRALHVLDFDSADAFLLSTRDSAIYLIDRTAPGLETQALTTVDRTRSVAELRLTAVPATLISEDPALLTRALDLGRLALAADTLGAASAMLTAAVDYAKQREQFNRPIASFQAVKHMCAEMAASLEPCRAMVWYAGHAFSEDDADAHMIICHTKAHISEVGKRLAKTATEVHGGMGFTDLLGLHYWFKRIGFNRQTLGTPERLREEAARAQALCA